MVERKRGTMPAGRKEREDGKTAPAGTRFAPFDFEGLGGSKRNFSDNGSPLEFLGLAIKT